MVKRMLIEATHPEETRVVVLDGTRLEEFDVETSTKKQIKGNIYLAKVVRVEPSLQAAFVDYGGNRHGFLAFSEIHPDYYQIPVADRERLMAEVLRHEEEEESRQAARDRRREAAQARGAETGAAALENVQADEHPHDEHAHEGHAHDLHAHDDHAHDHHHDDHADDEHGHDDAIPLAFIPPAITSTASVGEDEDEDNSERYDEAEATPAENPLATDDDHIMPPEAPTEIGGEASLAAPEATNTEESAVGDGQIVETAPAKPGGVETVGGEEEEEEAAEEKQRRRFVASRHYKIQEVIKRRQIMLIQVVKEERGNKGAALTTFLSLAGRYCVLMPNSPRGGGVSRKITSAQDRRRLKAILGDLELPKNMAVILRTAGAERNKTEIKRDYEYLQRTWNSIREVTMTSRAPALIHEEASLIKRAIRDIYSRDIEEVWVEGEEGYKIGKDFMKMLTPSHAKKVQRYKDDIIPLFNRYQVESQMEAINSPTVQLRSGGSIVFAQTEALVAIDVNSGRATKERHIEETAYKTNIEAADEIARQLRLRDLAGLIVIDFIDMEDNRNNHGVERRLKEALKADRARIQVGRISHFGLLELSRQRLRPSLIEANFRVCSHCAGSGMVRSTESAAVYSLRMLEEEGGRQRSSEVTITVHPDVALYLLNYKRDSLASIESRYRIKIFVLGDPHLVPPNFRIERVKAVRGDDAIEHAHREPPREIERERPAPVEVDDEDDDTDETESAAEPRAQDSRQQDQRPPREDGAGRKRRRRRRRRGGEPREGGQIEPQNGEASNASDGQQQRWQQLPSPAGAENEDGDDSEGADGDQSAAGEANGQPGGQPREEVRRGRRRGRRGGRRRRRGGSEQGATSSSSENNGNGTDGVPTTSWSVSEQQADSDPVDRAENAAPAQVAATAQTSVTETQPTGEDAANGSESKPSRFFRALKQGAKSWRRGDSADGAAEEAAPPAPPPAPLPSAVVSTPEEPSPTRRGWWSEPKE